MSRVGDGKKHFYHSCEKLENLLVWRAGKKNSSAKKHERANDETRMWKKQKQEKKWKE